MRSRVRDRGLIVCRSFQRRSSQPQRSASVVHLGLSTSPRSTRSTRRFSRAIASTWSVAVCSTAPRPKPPPTRRFSRTSGPRPRPIGSPRASRSWPRGRCLGVGERSLHWPSLTARPTAVRGCRERRDAHASDVGDGRGGKEGRPLYGGVRYLSRFQSHECWAVFNGAVVDTVRTSPITLFDSELTTVARDFGITLH